MLATLSIQTTDPKIHVSASGASLSVSLAETGGQIFVIQMTPRAAREMQLAIAEGLADLTDSGYRWTT